MTNIKTSFDLYMPLVSELYQRYAILEDKKYVQSVAVDLREGHSVLQIKR